MSLSQQSLREIARTLPGATAILHKYRLDFCCHGQQSLHDAAQKGALDLAVLIEELQQLEQQPVASENWLIQSSESLIEHLLFRYHEVHRQQLPELIRLATRVERAHKDRAGCPLGLSGLLQRMRDELESHMQKEENILFPMISQGLSDRAHAPVSVMRHEHDNHGETLAAIDLLTHNITLPDDACNTWHALYLGLHTFKRDLMEHIHLENNILFERIDGQLAEVEHD